MYFFSLHTLLSKNTVLYTHTQKKKKKKKDKVAQQNGIVDVQRKNTVRAFALLYIRKKSTNSMIEKKKKVHIEQTKSTLTFTHSPNNYHNISQNIYF